MQLAERLTLTDKARSSDGYLKVHARAARAGVYDYLGAEIDPEGKHFKATDTVKVYRPAAEVFDKASLASFALRPITDDHPSASVNASNWRDHARGAIIGAVKDGEYVGFDLAFMDAETVEKIDSGKRELSNGYSCDLSIEDGTAPDGTAYQAVQRNIRGNHVALVDKGRAGPDCRIADSTRWAACDANPSALDGLSKENPMKIKIGDAEVDATNGEAVRIAVDTLNVKLAALDKRATDAEAKVVEHAATITARDTKIAELEKSLADSAITPAKLADAAKEYAEVQAKAKALGVTVAVDADTAAIKKAVVDAKMGDAAKDYTADHVGIAFTALTKDTSDPVRDALRDGVRPTETKELQDAYSAMVDDLTNAWKPKQAA